MMLNNYSHGQCKSASKHSVIITKKKKKIIGQEIIEKRKRKIATLKGCIDPQTHTCKGIEMIFLFVCTCISRMD